MIRPLQRRPHFVQFSAINGRLQAPLAAVVTDELYPGNPQRPSMAPSPLQAALDLS